MSPAIYHALQLAAKSAKLSRVWAKLQQAEQSARDVHADIQHEREEFLDVLHELSKQLKLKQIVIDNFVPPDMASLVSVLMGFVKHVGDAEIFIHI
jgi:kinesin family protein 3/17